jgi:hypothetical protein
MLLGLLGLMKPQAPLIRYQRQRQRWIRSSRKSSRRVGEGRQVEPRRRREEAAEARVAVRREAGVEVEVKHRAQGQPQLSASVVKSSRRSRRRRRGLLVNRWTRRKWIQQSQQPSQSREQG